MPNKIKDFFKPNIREVILCTFIIPTFFLMLLYFFAYNNESIARILAVPIGWLIIFPAEYLGGLFMSTDFSLFSPFFIFLCVFFTLWLYLFTCLLSYVFRKIITKNTRIDRSRNTAEYLFAILFNLLITFVSIILIATLVVISFPCAGCGRHSPDTRIKTAIAQARTVMVYTYNEKGSYDSFNCQMEEMKSLCDDVLNHSYLKTSLKIINFPAINSVASCFYAPLNEKNGTTWFCVDSSGEAGVTSINPATPGYCLDGQSAKCPPLID